MNLGRRQDERSIVDRGAATIRERLAARAPSPVEAMTDAILFDSRASLWR